MMPQIGGQRLRYSRKKSLIYLLILQIITYFHCVAGTVLGSGVSEVN